MRKINWIDIPRGTPFANTPNSNMLDEGYYVTKEYCFNLNNPEEREQVRVEFDRKFVILWLYFNVVTPMANGSITTAQLRKNIHDLLGEAVDLFEKSRTDDGPPKSVKGAAVFPWLIRLMGKENGSK